MRMTAKNLYIASRWSNIDMAFFTCTGTTVSPVILTPGSKRIPMLYERPRYSLGEWKYSTRVSVGVVFSQSLYNILLHMRYGCKQHRRVTCSNYWKLSFMHVARAMQGCCHVHTCPAAIVYVHSFLRDAAPFSRFSLSVKCMWLALTPSSGYRYTTLTSCCCSSLDVSWWYPEIFNRDNEAMHPQQPYWIHVNARVNMTVGKAKKRHELAGVICMRNYKTEKMLNHVLQCTHNIFHGCSNTLAVPSTWRGAALKAKRKLFNNPFGGICI